MSKTRRGRRGGHRKRAPGYKLVFLDDGDVQIRFVDGPYVRLGSLDMANRYLAVCGGRWKQVSSSVKADGVLGPVRTEKNLDGIFEEPEKSQLGDNFGSSQNWVRLLVNKRRKKGNAKHEE